jgi:hypothetical protein
MSESVDFYTQGGQMIASGHTLTWVFWWDEDANPSNYQDVWLAVENFVDNYNTVPTLSISGLGTTRGIQHPSTTLNIIHWRTITNNLPSDSEPALFAFNMIKVPSGS